MRMESSGTGRRTQPTAGKCRPTCGEPQGRRREGVPGRQPGARAHRHHSRPSVSQTAREGGVLGPGQPPVAGGAVQVSWLVPCPTETTPLRQMALLLFSETKSFTLQTPRQKVTAHLRKTKREGKGLWGEEGKWRAVQTSRQGAGVGSGKEPPPRDKRERDRRGPRQLPPPQQQGRCLSP